MLAFWIFLALRRHRAHRLEVAALAGQPRGRAPLGEDDDDDDGDAGMLQQTDAPIPVSLAGLAGAYMPLRERTVSGDLDLVATALTRTPSDERSALIDAPGLTSEDVLAVPPPSARRAHRSSSFVGPEPAAWLGGRDISADPFRDPVPPSPLSAQRYSPDDTGVLGGSGGEDVEQLGGGAGGSGSSQRASGGSNGFRTSGDVLRRQSGGASSSGHSSSGHGHASEQGHRLSSHGHGMNDGRRSPGPSSLLPTQPHPAVPPTAYRPMADEEEEGESAPRRMGILGRSLRWKRGRSSSATSVPGSMGGNNATGSAPGSNGFSSASTSQSNTLLSPPASLVQSPTASFYDPPRLARPPSIIRPNSSALGGLSVPVLVLPEQGFMSSRPDLPSPAPTEGSSRAPEGLLHPHLGALGPVGMRSTGAISFRDDMDYSRPIGGLVNNRQYSSTTVHTVDSNTRPSTRRTSQDSERSNT
ncbi:hypothetical protein BKA93DRAFT_829881 [Sparassis latifolia]